MDTTQNDLTRLSLFLGTSISDRLQFVSIIKDAMCAAIMVQVENDAIHKEDKNFEVYQTIYLEAKHLEIQLLKL